MTDITFDGTYIIISNGVATLTTINAVLNNTDLLENLLPKEWLLKVPVKVQGLAGRLDINNSDCDLLKMKGLPSAITIQAENGASIFVDNAHITGWDVANNADIAVSAAQPRILSNYNNSLNITNTYFKHAYIEFLHDKIPDTVDGCTFFESNPAGISSTYSLYKTITNNKFIDCYSFSYSETQFIWEGASVVPYYTYTNFSHNYAKGKPGLAMGDNCQIGAGSTIIGNEIIYGGWNLIEVRRDTLCRDNILHDNGGNHNAFNIAGDKQGWDRYFINDYCYNIDNYTCFYAQVCCGIWCDPFAFPRRTYVINGKVEHCGGGFSSQGGYDSYVYNLTTIDATNSISMGSGNNYIRKSRFTNTNLPKFPFKLVDFQPATYGYFEDVTFIDTVFKDNQYDMMIGLVVDVNPVINLINTYNEGSTSPPVIIWDNIGGELREYVYLDVLVQDLNGNSIQGATITIENLDDPDYPAINLTLPPPPPDLWKVPEEPLPIPSIQNLASITTGSTGHTPLPNYGWSPNPASTIALMFQKRGHGGATTAGYNYKITAEKDSYFGYATLIPTASWYRSIPDTYQNTITIVLDIEGPTSLFTHNAKSCI